MKYRILKTTVALALSLCIGLSAGNAEAAEKKDYVFGVGVPGGVWEMVGTAIAKVLNQYASFRLVPVTVTTNMSNPVSLSKGEMAFAMGSFDVSERAFRGEDIFKGKETQGTAQVLSIYDNVMGFLVLGNSKLTAMDEITDKTIIASPPGNYVNNVAYLNAMKAAGILKADPAKVAKNFHQVTWAQSLDQLVDGNADIALATGFPYNGMADSVITTKGARFIPVSKDPAAFERFRAEFDKKNREVTMQAIPAGTYATTTEPVWGYVYYSCIYAGKSVDNAVVKEFVELAIKHMKEIAAIHPSAAGLTIEANKRNLESGIMQKDRMHPAAVEYFKGLGIIK